MSAKQSSAGTALNQSTLSLILLLNLTYNTLYSKGLRVYKFPIHSVCVLCTHSDEQNALKGRRERLLTARNWARIFSFCKKACLNVTIAHPGR